jgi:hypothetical protein
VNNYVLSSFLSLLPTLLWCSSKWFFWCHNCMCFSWVHSYTLPIKVTMYVHACMYFVLGDIFIYGFWSPHLCNNYWLSQTTIVMYLIPLWDFEFSTCFYSSCFHVWQYFLILPHTINNNNNLECYFLGS